VKYRLIIFALALVLSGCAGANYQDGVYSGRSGVDDTGAWGEVTITIAGGRTVDCQFITRQKDGAVKDENYGKVNGEISNRDFYDKAQLAVRAMAHYARQYGESGDLEKVDAVSGATIAYNQFLEAVENALEKAKR
jgi:major membrane immunogen (membrane-anchored lipoprotein)